MTTTDNESEYPDYEEYVAENPDAVPVGDDGPEQEEDPADGGDVAVAPQEGIDGTEDQQP